LKIGLDASSLPANVAGAGKYVCGLIQGLAQIDVRNEYMIFVKAGTQNFFDALPDNFQAFQLPNFSRPSRLLWQHIAAGSAGRQCRLDIWHGLHYSLPHFHGAMRTVSTFHDVAFFLHPQLYPPVKRLYFQQTIRRAWNVADAVIGVSRSTANDARCLFGERNYSASQRLHVVHSGIDDRFFSAVVPEKITRVRNRYALSAPYILFVGTLEKRKNLPLLISAFRRLRDLGYCDLLLVLAGLPSNGQAEVEKAIARENLNDAVRCLGYITDADILPLYQGAQLFVLPSMHEGFGFPLLEAMASGVPALAANNSAMRELAADQDMLCCGAVEVWASKMEQMLFNTKLRQKLIARGLRQAREFSWQQTAWATLQVYESVYESVRKRLQPTPEKKMIARRSAAPAENIFMLDRKSAEIGEAVLKTLAYADLFDHPLRLEEIHDGLLDCGATVNEVNDALQDWERRGVIAQSSGLFFLRDRRQLVAVREQRRQQTQALLQKHAWLLRLLVKFPGVRSVSLSGAAAFENCKPADDLDVFIITAPRRLWTVYVALVILLKLIGKRKTICLNCLFDQEHLRLNERDFFVAHQIAFLRPFSGGEYFRQFLLANAWIYSHLPQRRRTAETLAIAPEKSGWKKFVEKIGAWRLFDHLEKTLFALYRRRIQLKTAHLPGDGVVIQPGQIRLFTNNHRHRIKDALQRRVQEISQHDFLAQEVEASHAVF
jgi:glycosyltransferase involved in cell wall biosynthesis